MLRLALPGAALALVFSASAHAFCGFYVGKADAQLFNRASQVILVREGDRTVISMLNDYQGALAEFALVVPVPQVLQRDQIHVGDKKLFERIDSYSAPRLAEYHDENPCMRVKYELEQKAVAPAAARVSADARKDRERALGVT